MTPAIIAAMAEQACTECAGPLVGVRAAQVRHPECTRAYKARWAREKRAQMRATASPEQLDAAAVENLKRATDYFWSLPAERQDALFLR